MAGTSGFRRVGACLVAMRVLLAAGLADGTVVVTEGGSISIAGESVVGLSGITWAGGTQFYAVSDRSGIVPVTLEIHPESGKITAGAIGKPWTMKTELSDFEGIAWQAAAGKLFVSAEGGPGIQGFSREGKPAERVALPAIFNAARPNLSLESLTCSPSGERFWTANEEALTVDGPVADAERGTVVRLQEFSAAWKPLRQFAWVTEPAGMRVEGSGSGVSDLCALPGGRLLVLERGFGKISLRCRLFLADFSAATDISRLPRLAGVRHTAAGKTLLLDKSTGLKNFEGMALGPPLKDGSRSLILVADSGNGFRHSFLALRISGLAGK